MRSHQAQGKRESAVCDCVEVQQMKMVEQCPECGAAWGDGSICETHFHQMLLWEWEDAGLFVVHHLMVLCYQIQHPRLYSPDGLALAKNLLIDFLENGLTTERARAVNRIMLDSGNRQIKIKGTVEAAGTHTHPFEWSMTATDVVSNGKERYIESVETWAQSVLDNLRASNNVPTPT